MGPCPQGGRRSRGRRIQRRRRAAGRKREMPCLGVGVRRQVHRRRCRCRRQRAGQPGREIHHRADRLAGDDRSQADRGTQQPSGDGQRLCQERDRPAMAAGVPQWTWPERLGRSDRQAGKGEIRHQEGRRRRAERSGRHGHRQRRCGGLQEQRHRGDRGILSARNGELPADRHADHQHEARRGGHRVFAARRHRHDGKAIAAGRISRGRSAISAGPVRKKSPASPAASTC